MNFIEMVANGTAAFGIAAQEQVLQARASDAKIPIVAIAAILQHNTSGFASPEARGIRSPKDSKGKRTAVGELSLNSRDYENAHAKRGLTSAK